jgi:hypothetical protein
VRTFAFPAARQEPRVLVWARRTVIAVACVHLLFASWSFYRRLHQVLRIDLRAPSTALYPGAVVHCDVITSGETKNRILLELVQGSHSEVMLELRARVNRISAYDPRVFRYTPSVTVTPALLSRFAPGPATVRLTGFGGMKLLHTPAPRVRELLVLIPPLPDQR